MDNYWYIPINSEDILFWIFVGMWLQAFGGSPIHPERSAGLVDVFFAAWALRVSRTVCWVVATAPFRGPWRRPNASQVLPWFVKTNQWFQRKALRRCRSGRDGPRPGMKDGHLAPCWMNSEPNWLIIIWITVLLSWITAIIFIISIYIVVFSLKLFSLQFTYLWDPGVSLWDLQVPIVPLRTRSIRNAAKHPVAWVRALAGRPLTSVLVGLTWLTLW